LYDRSLYSNEVNATYTFEAELVGSYEVSLWWTYWSNRCTNVPVEIYDGETLLDTVEVNHRTNSSQWNVLGTYTFNGTARVVIISEGGCTTGADAVRFLSAFPHEPPELDYIEIEGPHQFVNESSSTQYFCRAYYTDGANRLVDPESCEVDCTEYAEITRAGELETFDVDEDQQCQITMTYTEGDITRTAAVGTTIKDFVAPTEFFIDNGDPGTTSTGTWRISAGSNPYDVNSLYSRGVLATYTYETELYGSYQVSLWWTYALSRCTNVPVEIYDGETLLDIVEVNQKANGGKWNPLGTYVFSGTARVVIVSESSDCSTNADAVKFLSALPPELDYIEIEGPQFVNESSSARYFYRAYYTDGANRLVDPESCEVDCTEYAEITRAGELETFDVDEDQQCQITMAYTEGDIIRSAAFDITIRNFDAPTVTVIIDNDKPGTSYTGGPWGYSSGANPYGGSSRTEMQQGAAYTFEATISGDYEVSLWWTYWRSRCTNVPVDIYDGNTLLDTVRVNHQENDGQWNLLGAYFFSSGTARVVIRSESNSCSTCADAVRFEP